MNAPSLRKLTAELRALHSAYAHPDAGGEYVKLHVSNLEPDTWCVAPVGATGWSWPHYGREYVPGDGAPFDAVAAARRLLAAFRDSHP